MDTLSWPGVRRRCLVSRDRGWEGFRKTWRLSGSQKRMFQTGHKVAEGACVRHRGVSWGWVEVLLSQDRWEGTVLRWRGLWAGPPPGRVSSGPVGRGRTAKARVQARVQEKVVLGDGDQHEEPTERC